jgi:hypothetical protein
MLLNIEIYHQEYYDYKMTIFMFRHIDICMLLTMEMNDLSDRVLLEMLTVVYLVKK